MTTTDPRPTTASDRLFRALLRLWPEHFREDLGEAFLDAYRDRARRARRDGGAFALARVWLAAAWDSLRNGLAERLRPSLAWRRTGDWGWDVQLVGRRLRRSPGFTLSAAGTLAVGLAAFAVVWSAVDTVLLEPPPYERPDELYVVWRDYTWMGFPGGAMSGPDVAALDTAGGAIAGALAIDTEDLTLEGAGADGEPERVRALVSSPELFRLLGMPPALGRGFAPGEAGPGRAGVAVLSHALWARRFGASPDALGAEVRLDGEPFTVVGVLGPEQRLLMRQSMAGVDDAALYLTFDEDVGTTDPGGGSYSAILRARPGAAPEAVAAAVDAVGRRVDEEVFDGQGLRFTAHNLQADLVANVRPALVVLAVAAALLVLVLALNLAALLLARMARRERELAVSRALGAGSAAVARAVLLESLALGVLGAAAGTLIAVWGARAFAALAPASLPRRDDIAVDAGVAATVLAVGAALGLLAGLWPAARAARADLGALLRTAAVRGGGGARVRRGLVVAQVALSLTLLAAGGLLARSLAGVLRSDPGFQPAGALAFRAPTPADRYADDDAERAFQDRLRRELARVPGVAAVGAVSSLPLSADASQMGVAFPAAPGNTGDADADQPLADIHIAGPGADRALGARLLEGRWFRDGAGADPWEVVIDHTLARRFFPEGGALGARVTVGSPTDTGVVVGVVQQVRQWDVHADDRGQVWADATSFPVAETWWVLRTARPPASLAVEARAVLRALDPAVPMADVRTLDSLVDDAVAEQRLSAGLVAGFAAAALLLAAMGLYGLVAGAVTARRQELCVRMALGAPPPRVLRMLLGEAGRLVAGGALLAVPALWLAARLLGGVLVGVSAFDPLVLAAAAALLGLVALLACWVPARRVARLDPARALGSE